jgi:hypothetical protein
MSTTVETPSDIRPFQVDIPDEALEDLRRRIAATNWPRKRPSPINPKACRSP